MEKRGIFLALVFTIVCAFGYLIAEKAMDKNHYHYGKECPFEGMECPLLNRDDIFPTTKALQFVNACDYQLELETDSIKVFDGQRYVGTIPMWDGSPLDSLILKDNE